MGIICESCGRDIDTLGQDNMSCTCEPLCEDCWNEQQSHAVAVLRRENDRLRGDLAEMGRKLTEARQRLRSDGPADCKRLRREVETAYEANRERALALTKLDECELWLGRCEPRVTASPTLKDAAMPCLKADEARGFAMPDVNVEVTAEELAKSLREAMKPAMRMAVE